MIAVVFFLVFGIRLISLSISIENEKRLIAEGARQYGEKNSKLLSAAHVVYYFAALGESYVRGAQFDAVSGAGTALLVFALGILFYVIHALGSVWTVKLYIHPQHKMNRNWLFRHVRHPNYFLNILPELIGVGLLCHAWGVMAVGLPIYAAILAVRIRHENEAMRHLW